MTDYQSLWTELLDTEHEIRYADAAGVRTRYLHAGNERNPTLVMLHGTAGSLENFALNLRELSKHFNCYAIDLLGSGYTDKPDYTYDISAYTTHLENFLKAIHQPRVSLMGVSLGSWIAASYAVRHPEQVDRLCLITPTGLNFYKEENEAIARVRGKAAGEPTWDSIKSIFFRLVHREENHLDDMIALRLGIYKQPGYANAMKHVLELFAEEVWVPSLVTRDQFRALRNPTLVVVSPDDKNPVYTEAGREIAQLIPNAQLLEMKDVAHWPQFEDPATFNRAFIQFFKAR